MTGKIWSGSVNVQLQCMCDCVWQGIKSAAGPGAVPSLSPNRGLSTKTEFLLIRLKSNCLPAVIIACFFSFLAIIVNCIEFFSVCWTNGGKKQLKKELKMTEVCMCQVNRLHTDHDPHDHYLWLRYLLKLILLQSRRQQTNKQSGNNQLDHNNPEGQDAILCKVNK